MHFGIALNFCSYKLVTSLQQFVNIVGKKVKCLISFANLCRGRRIVSGELKQVSRQLG